MKRVSLVLTLFLIFTSFMNLNAQWARTYGGSGLDSAYSIQQTSDGGYIVAGQTMSFGAGGYDVCVLKLDSIGDIEWQRTYGGSDYDGAKSIQETSDEGYIVAGYTYSFGAGEADFWILKLSIIGDIEWQRSYGTTLSEGASSIQQTSDGGYIVIGSTHSIVGATGLDFWILKLTSNGDVEWQCIYETVYKLLYPPSICQASDGGYIVGASDAPAHLSGLNRDFWILKLTSTGDIAWQYTTGGDSRDSVHDIQLTNDGGFIVVGEGATHAEGQGAWVLKLTSTGYSEWGYVYYGYTVYMSRVYHWDYLPHSIQQTREGGYIITGRATYYRDGAYQGWGIWVLKLASTGVIEWQKLFGGSGEEGWSIQQTGDGGYVIAGDKGIKSESGDCNFLILKLSPDGDIAPPCEFTNPLSCPSEVSPLGGGGSMGFPTSITPQDTNVVPLDTIITPQDTNATVSQCGIEYSFTISSSIGGSTKPPSGTYAHSPFYSGAEVQIEALPNAGYRFSGWTGNAPSGHENDNPITIIMDSDKSIEANFIRQHALTVASGGGGTTDPEPGAYTYDYGMQVQVTAMPDSGYQFTHWSGDASGTATTIIITMDADKSITANFSLIPSPEEPEEPEKKNGCFIATAAYGSPLQFCVKILRDFRDSYLMPNKPGRVLIDLYYKYSPYVAELIAKHKVLKVAVRISLLPLVAFSYSMVHFGPIMTVVMVALFFALPIFLILFFRRKLSRLKAKSPKAPGFPGLK